MACSLGRFLELIIAALCLYLHLKTPYEKEPLLTSVSAIFWGYSIALLVIVVADCCMDKPLERGVHIFFSLISCVVFGVIGLLITQDWHGGFNEALHTQEFELAKYKAMLAIANAVLFLLDGFFTCCCID